MKLYNYILPLVIFTAIFCFSANTAASSFSMGSGGFWVELCSGHNEEYPEEIGKELCFTTLLSYQVGALTQAMELGKPPSLCSRLDKYELIEGFINYIKLKEARFKKDFVEIYPQYLKRLNDCSIDIKTR